MSNCIINLRIVYWHLQVLRDRPYVRFSYNAYHKINGIGWRWVEWY